MRILRAGAGGKQEPKENLRASGCANNKNCQIMSPTIAQTPASYGARILLTTQIRAFGPGCSRLSIRDCLFRVLPDLATPLAGHPSRDQPKPSRTLAKLLSALLLFMLTSFATSSLLTCTPSNSMPSKSTFPRLDLTITVE
ncbi:MAG: hypothetical protein A4E45_00317 [Methanosaeta sp. PtaB.Bin039]|nr:MAG: hypothetical protein A4E45_00317 [Methanosaeta sp. PtaB.Bin039]OPY44741.1 MAG: hypothetical protein A4E47_01323 [Methanosaeta sp. PtaU1.Bin028]